MPRQCPTRPILGRLSLSITYSQVPFSNLLSLLTAMPNVLSGPLPDYVSADDYQYVTVKYLSTRVCLVLLATWL
jgi:hypothetical protein